MGANKAETVKVLLDAGASIDFQTFSGGNALTAAVDTDDSDPDVVRMVLEKFKSSLTVKEFTSILNYRLKALSVKWKALYFVSKCLKRMGISKSGVMHSMALWSGTTALNLAVMRGDVEIVKILLTHGADPSIKNDLGMSAFKICDLSGPFRNVKTALQEHGQ